MNYFKSYNVLLNIETFLTVKSMIGLLQELNVAFINNTQAP